MGTIAVLQASHNDPGFRKLQDTYGNLDTEKAGLDGSGWFCTDPREVGRFGGVWRTADFEAGDITLFGMRTGGCHKKGECSTGIFGCVSSVCGSCLFFLTRVQFT